VLDAQAFGEITAAQPVLLPELDEYHLLADVKPVLGEELPNVNPVSPADLRQDEARILPDRM
jgi:hypothetical protein